MSGDQGVPPPSDQEASPEEEVHPARIDPERFRMGAIIARFRKVKNLRQPEFGSVIGINQTTLSRIERGYLILNADQISKLAKHWPDFPVVELLGIQSPASEHSFFQDLLTYTKALEKEVLLSDAMKRLRTAHAIYLTLYFESNGNPEITLAPQYRRRLLQILDLLQ